jgi:hypothetical protein
MMGKKNPARLKDAAGRPLEPAENAPALASAEVKALAKRETEVLAGEQTVLSREEDASHREEVVDLREKVVDQREEMAGQREKALRKQKGTTRVKAALVKDTTAQLREANERLVVATVRAQTMADAAEQTTVQMAYMAEHDFLTGLPNRALLSDRLAQAITLARRYGKRVALMYLDIDHFKHINDSLGHTVGDRLLQSLAKRLQACVRQPPGWRRIRGVADRGRGGPGCDPFRRKAHRSHGPAVSRRWASTPRYPEYRHQPLPRRRQGCRDGNQECRYRDVSGQEKRTQQIPGVHTGYE